MSSARDLTLTLFGRFLRERDGWIAIAHLAALLEPLGVDPASTRSAVSRLKRDGILEPAERNRQAGYALTDAGTDFFEDGDARIFETSSAGDPRWVLATFSVPEAERNLRYRIRATLLDLGFGQLGGGLLIAPAARLDEAVRRLTREDLHERTRLWIAEHGPLGGLADVVTGSWDLDAIEHAYDAVLHVARRTPADELGNGAAFAWHLEAIDAWRAARYLDPGLPLSVMKTTWPEAAARAAFFELDAGLRPQSLAHLDATAIEPKRRAA